MAALGAESGKSFTRRSLWALQARDLAKVAPGDALDVENSRSEASSVTLRSLGAISATYDGAGPPAPQALTPPRDQATPPRDQADLH
jgi:hypothetical protein